MTWHEGLRLRCNRVAVVIAALMPDNGMHLAILAIFLSAGNAQKNDHPPENCPIHHLSLFLRSKFRACKQNFLQLPDDAVAAAVTTARRKRVDPVGDRGPHPGFWQKILKAGKMQTSTLK